MHEDVPGRKVPVDDPALMAVGDSSRDLEEVLPQSALIEAFSGLLLFLDDGRQVSSFCVVHDDVEDGVLLCEISQGDDELTLQGVELLGFSHGQFVISI